MADKTKLYEKHKQLGGRLIAFAGFDMPVWYSNLKEEHLAVRDNVGMFDISHMGLFKVSGEGAADFLQYMSCNDINKTKPHKMVYSMVLNEKGMVLDDIMLGYLDGDYIVVVNASNKQKIWEWFHSHKPETVVIEDLNKAYSFTAVQGPNSVDSLSTALSYDFHLQDRFNLAKVTVLGQSCIAMRTGYTGEDGYELMVPHEGVEALWNVLLEKGVVPCGLGARDSLRLEKGLPLYGQELSENTHPLMTRYPWVVAWDTEFLGKEALETSKQNIRYKAVGLELPEKCIPRPHFAIKEGGEVTSGTLSPSLNKPIALAFVPVSYSELGSKVTVEIRGKEAVAEVVKVPFL